MSAAVSESLSGDRATELALGLLFAPLRLPVEQLWPCRGDHEQGNVGRRVEQVVEELKQPCVRPVQILDHHDEGPSSAHRLDDASPGGEKLGLVGTWSLSIAQPEQRRQPCPEPLALRALADECLQRGVQLGYHVHGRVGLKNAGLGLDDLPQGPERDAVPIRQAATLTPRHELLAVVDEAPELLNQPALADSGLTEQSHQPTPNVPARYGCSAP